MEYPVFSLVDPGRIKKVETTKPVAHEYSFLVGFLQAAGMGVSTKRSSQGRTFKHEGGGSGSMPRPRLLRLTSYTLFLAPSPCILLSFRFSTLFAVFLQAPENPFRDGTNIRDR